MGNCTALITIWRSKKKTAPIMRFTVCRGRRKSQRGTRNYPLPALDLTGHLKHRARWGLCAGQQKKVEGLEDFHFHMLRHTYTSNLLSNGAAPKDVQELLGHADVSTTMNIYAHATREAKRTSARLLDKVIGGA